MKKTSRRSGPVRLAIIGTGGMARQHAIKFKEVKGCTLVAAVDVSRERAETFAQTHGIPEIYGSVDELLAAGTVDAVAIVTPDAFHAEVAIQCLKAGKHVLCEKPLAVNYPDAQRMVKAAAKAGVINMVNFSYRDMPSLQAVAKLVHSGKLGEIRHVEASYLQSWLASKVWGDWRTDPKWLWRLSSQHGSKGVLGDVGVHILDFATFPAGPLKSVYCKLKTFDKAPGNRIGEYLLDANDSAVMTVEFANGALGTIHTTRWMGGHANRLYLKIAGTLGSVVIDGDWGTNVYRTSLGSNLDKAKWREHKAPRTPNNYARFIRGIRTGKQEEPTFARGAEVQRVLDACYVSDGKNAPVKLPAAKAKAH
ncbi:Gfo/Idh/MocA family oxidoreductase [Ruficoccus amylovorans]|uniref:Gfo/Idh/MocA family oxidoreductase n=1 Tax=Ruficoccus amylovorans TaxID=1804625 RepID=A0A842HAV6_9BACT|nr:Gfo/Idh/MocA family oxidoreductase [Ruficoccus amylovorans]MBC2593410.1 Gfo/Idh/MocA family oxidoreductase [Ruficoccus amylovorans]